MHAVMLPSRCSRPVRRRAAAHATTVLLAWAGTASAWAQSPPAADNCEGIRQQIEARFRGGGIANPGLLVAPAGSSSGGGRVVGSCANGSRQIVYTGAGSGAGAGAGSVGAAPGAAGAARTAERPAERTGAPATAAPAALPSNANNTTSAPSAAADKIPTECKDGSIVIGPRCDDPRAVRMTSAEIAGITAAAASAASAPAPAATPPRAASQ